MDHVGDMLGYLHDGLRKMGYRGILSWGDIDRYRERPPESDDWEILSRSRARALMTSKDGAFWITIEHAEFMGGDPPDVPAHEHGWVRTCDCGECLRKPVETTT